MKRITGNFLVHKMDVASYLREAQSEIFDNWVQEDVVEFASRSKAFQQQILLGIVGVVRVIWHADAVREEDLEEIDKLLNIGCTESGRVMVLLLFSFEQIQEVYLEILLDHNSHIAQTLLSQHA